MVKGKKINDEEVYETMKMFLYQFVITLNLIDNFLSLEFPFFKHIPFACSFREIDWNSLGISSLKLDYLGFILVIFHEAKSKSRC